MNRFIKYWHPIFDLEFWLEFYVFFNTFLINPNWEWESYSIVFNSAADVPPLLALASPFQGLVAHAFLSGDSPLKWAHTRSFLWYSCDSAPRPILKEIFRWTKMSQVVFNIKCNAIISVARIDKSIHRKYSINTSVFNLFFNKNNVVKHEQDS